MPVAVSLSFIVALGVVSLLLSVAVGSIFLLGAAPRVLLGGENGNEFGLVWIDHNEMVRRLCCLAILLSGTIRYLSLTFAPAGLLSEVLERMISR